MSTDAREAWLQKAVDKITFILAEHVTSIISGEHAGLDEEIKKLSAHLRTTPEGYALVKVELLNDAKDALCASTTAEKERVMALLSKATKGAE